MSIKLYNGDCLEILPTLSENSIDSIVTDPPYGIQFMNKKWDYDVPSVSIWKEVLRILKPGGHMIAFSSTRTYHRMACNIENAGFEIRDQISWLYSQGIPHGSNIAKSIAKIDPELSERWEGWHTYLKPSVEPIVLAIKPYEDTIAQNVMKYGVGGLNIDENRIPVDLDIDDARLGGQGTWSTEGMAKNVYGNYGNKVSGSIRSISSPLGRFPANVIHDNSEEVNKIFDSFGEKSSGVPGKRRKEHFSNSMGKLGILDRDEVGYADKGSVARFFQSCEFNEEEKRIFYCPKVSPKERGKSTHPTLKPLSLMKYLTKLITPKNGIILDPFAGTGTTGLAAIQGGFSSILIEKEEEYYKECINKLALWLEE